MGNTYQIPELDIGATVPVEFAYTVTDADASDGLTITATASVEGAEASASIQPQIAQPAAVDFETASWADVADRYEPTEEDLKSHKTRIVELSDGLGTCEVEVVGGDMDSLSDGSGKARLTLAFRTAPNLQGAIGNEKGRCETIYEALPDDLKSVIVEVDKANHNFYSSRYNRKLWTFSQTELCGDSSVDNPSGKQYQYPGFDSPDVTYKGGPSLVRNGQSGEPVDWVLAGSAPDDDSYGYRVSKTGSFEYVSSGTSSYMMPGFCIGEGGGLSNLLGLLMARAIIQRFTHVRGGGCRV